MNKKLFIGLVFAGMTTLSACVTQSVAPVGYSEDSQELTDSRYVYSYCLFRGAVTLGYKNNWQIDNEVEKNVLQKCAKYRREYEKAIQADAFRGRTDFAPSDLERFKSLTADAVLKEAERIVFNGARVDLKRVEEASK